MEEQVRGAKALAAQYELLFDLYSSQGTWTEIAKSPREFASEMDDLLSRIETAKGLPLSK
jgi:lipocalin